MSRLCKERRSRATRRTRRQGPHSRLPKGQPSYLGKSCRRLKIRQISDLPDWPKIKLTKAGGPVSLGVLDNEVISVSPWGFPNWNLGNN